MHRGPHDPASRDPGSIDFEPTDLSTARAALDELPPGVERLPTLAPGYWEQRRRKPQATDRALSGGAIDWVLSLPPSLRPRELCERFPRVANALAEVWRDPARRAALLDDLLLDRRGGRQGFPPEIRREIEQLRRA